MAADNMLPIFGTVSLASIVGLLVGIRALISGIKDDIVQAVLHSDGLAQKLKDCKTECDKKYPTREELSNVKAIARHAEASIPGCAPLKETRAINREDMP